MKITKKKIVVLESFVTVGSFDCDRTHLVFWGEAPLKTEWLPYWPILLYNFFGKLKLEVIKNKKEMTNTSKIPPTPKY